MRTATYALLIDGSTVEICAAGPEDGEAVRAMHAALSPENAYLRFFGLSPLNAEREARRVCREPGPDHAALLAWLGGELAGVASYEPTAKPGTAEIAFAIPDHLHGRGLATLLLEHLVSIARQRRIEAFMAETLAENAAMLAVFTAAGLPVERQLSDGEWELTFPLPAGETDRRLGDYLDSVAARERRADLASLSHLLRPDSIAIVGASRHRGSPGREILHNIITGGFAGKVHPVNPHAQSMEGLPCLRSAADLPLQVDVAVVAVPAPAVPGVAAECGRRGVRSLVVITALGAEGADLLAICRRYGMRLVGPNCSGIAVPGLSLDATFAAHHPVPGPAGLVVQSGGIGMFLLEHLSRLGIGVSSFASVGAKYDVSSNDLLTWWEQDGQTRLAVLSVESFGSPRKFARTARHVARQMAVLTVISGRSAVGQRTALSHAVAATPLVTQEALFAQAGVIALKSLGELLETVALLASQPLPAGDRIAIVTNAGGAGLLAADACADHGLRAATLSVPTQHRLRDLLLAGAAVASPVDTTASVGADVFRLCLEEVAADEGVDAVLAVIAPTAMEDVSGALGGAQVTKPLAAALLGQPETVLLLPLAGPGSRPGDGELPASEPGVPPCAPGIPAYAYPEAAARALGHAARYHAWLGSQRGRVPELCGVRTADARALVGAFLAASPAGGWLPAAAVSDLLSCYGIPPVPTRAVANEQESVAATDGVEVLVGVVQEPVFGPLVVFGLGGVASGAPGDHAARLIPLTDTDAASLIHGAQCAPFLFGHHGRAGVDTAALTGILLRVSRLADDIPEVAELDLNPVIARHDGAQVEDARVRISVTQPQDPFLRRLR